MRLDSAEREIERIGLGSSKTFSIKATAKAFKLLSSGLYSDKIRAIIREVASNAFDAHIVGGKVEQPFYVHLPNTLEPFFAVRDYGPGMSHEDMEVIYGTYFESTKSLCPDQIGAYGLGAKAPFAYTDSFAVTIFQNGRKRSYSIFLGEQGVPEIALMSEVETTEPDGMEVRIAVVNTADQNEFARKATTVLSYFKPQPLVGGCGSFAFLDRTPVLEGNGWTLQKRQGGAQAIIGPVAYPIVSTSPHAHIRRLYEAPLDIEFPIGSMEITLGREELGYERNTIEALEQRAKEILAETPVLIQRHFNECPNLYRARKLYAELFHGGNFFRIVHDGTKFMFRGAVIGSSSFSLDLTDGFEGMSVVSFDKPSRSHQHTTKHASITRDLWIDAKGDIVVRDDLQRGAISRAKFRRRSDHNYSMHIFRCTDEQWAKVREMLDGYPVEYVSAFPQNPRQPKRSAPQQNFHPYVLRAKSWHSSKINADDWHVDTSNPTEGLWVTYRSGRVISEETKETDIRFVKLMREVEKAGLLRHTERVYGLTLTLAKRVKAKPEWKPFREELKDRLAVEFKNPVVRQAVLTNRTLLDATRDEGEVLRRHRELLAGVARDLHDDHPLVGFYKDFPPVKAHMTSQIEALLGTAALLRVDAEALCGGRDEILRRWRSLANEYPLLQAAILQAVPTRQIIDYVLMVDQSKKAVNGTE